MKRLAAFVVLALALAWVGTAMADVQNAGTADVFVTVDPNVAVRPLVPYVNMGTIQTGIFQGFIPWRIDANTQNVKFWGGASYLYKGDDPTNTTVPPIMLDLTSGIVFTIAHGGPIGGEDTKLIYLNPVDIDGFPGMGTETTEYESSDPGHMSQDCMMAVKWNQADAERPMGEYSGKVRLSAMVVVF